MGGFGLIPLERISVTARALARCVCFCARVAVVGGSIVLGAGLAVGRDTGETTPSSGAPTSVVASGPGSSSSAATHVLVLYNSADPSSVQIADYYQQVHPGVHLLGLSGIPGGDDISAANYLSIIRPQVMAGLTSSINDIVTTQGLPLRIDNPTPATTPYTYSDALGTHTVYSTSWSSYESLEGALTRVSLVSTTAQLCDQTWWAPAADQSQNPYFNTNTSFSHSNAALQGMYLTSRLDGYTVSDVESEINNAQNVTITAGAEGFLIDNTSSGSSYGHTSMPQLVSNVLGPSGQSYVYNTTPIPATSAPFPVVGYDSYGTNEGLMPGYITDQLNFPIAKGGIFESWESYNAYSFTPGVTKNGQGLLADWIAKGGAAAVGNVQEPGGWLWAYTNEDTMFQMMLEGYTWAEAAWGATPRLDFVNTVIGDPLMTWNVVGLTGTQQGGGSIADQYDVVPEPTATCIVAAIGVIGAARRRGGLARR
jgi:uncharacterized protein (TIGR03790 family)